MSEHLTPDEETITGDRPANADDMLGHLQTSEQPGVHAAGNITDKASLFSAQDDEDDSERHKAAPDKAGAYSSPDDEGDTTGPGAFS